MKEYKRIKPRSSGKTTELIEMAKVLLMLGRNIILLTVTQNEQRRFKDELKPYIKGNNCVFGLQSNINHIFRGRTFDTIMVDDWDRFTPKAHEEINMSTAIYRANLITTQI